MHAQINFRNGDWDWLRKLPYITYYDNDEQMTEWERAQRIYRLNH